MGMDNRFVVLSDNKDKLERLAAFIKDVQKNRDTSTSTYKLITYDINIKAYGDSWGLESMFINSYLSDLEYWLRREGKTDLVEGCLVVVNYEMSDRATLYGLSGEDGVDLFDIFDGTVYVQGDIYETFLPMKELMEYFCVRN